LQPAVLADLQRKGSVRQRSLSAELIIHLLFVFNGVHEIATLSFLLLFDQAKSKRSPAAMSGTEY
jgi:hypothetical protein